MGLSWIFAITLALLFAVRALGYFSLRTLALPGVLPVALIVATTVSLALTPVAAWALRTGVTNLSIYSPVLWFILAAYIVVVIPRTGRGGLLGLLILAIVGLIILGFIPPSKRDELTQPN